MTVVSIVGSPPPIGSPSGGSLLEQRYHAARAEAGVTSPRSRRELNKRNRSANLYQENTIEGFAEQLFYRYDDDESGRLDINELKNVVKDMFLARGLPQAMDEDFINQQANLAISSAAIHNNISGTIGLSEFVLFLSNQTGLFGTLLGWHKVFEEFTGEDNESIDEGGLAKMVRKILERRQEASDPTKILRLTADIMATADADGS
eukprot:gene14476-17114_t